MTDLTDHAEEPQRSEVRRVSDLAQRPPAVLLDTELVEADEIGTDEFPQYGRFLHVQPLSQVGNRLEDHEYWECPKSLAQAIVEQADEPAGMALNVLEAYGGGEEPWDVTIAIEEPPE